MLPASVNVPIGDPECTNECEIHPYAAELYMKMDCTLTQGFDENNDPIPTGIIHLDQDDEAVMRIEVGLKGPLLHHLCGELCVRVHLECIGAGPEQDWPRPRDPDYRPSPGDVTSRKIQGEDDEKCCGPDGVDADGWCIYEFQVTIPNETFEEYGRDCGEVCCFAVTATSRDRCGNPGHLACWCNGPCVMIHLPPEA